MQRGEIRYITRPTTYGSEMYAAGRPAVIVSSQALASTAPVQQVVYLTKQPKREMPTHVIIHSTGVRSTVICEQVTTVDNECVGDLLGVCTEAEMLQIGIAIATSLGLEDFTGLQTEPEEVDEDAGEAWDEMEQELTRTKAELAASERFIGQLLDRLAAKGA